MASSKGDVYEKEMKSQFNKFIFKLCSRLVDVVEKREHDVNRSPQLNNIAQAIVTLMYIYRVRYRHLYMSVHHKIIHRNQFIEFCAHFYDHENLPYYFTFLLNISLKFEMFLYLREEGINYFGSLAHTIAVNLNYSKFESTGGAEELSHTATFFLRITDNLQLLVNTEYPCRKKLLSLEEQIFEIETKYFELYEENSFIFLKEMSRNLYKGLQNYSDAKVLPFIILRFILEGRIPDSPETNDKPAIIYNTNEETIIKYFDRCLTPEIMSGIAYKYVAPSFFPTELSFDKNEMPSAQVNPADCVCNEEKKINQKVKVEVFSSNSENSSLESAESSGDELHRTSLEWLKRCDAEAVSLLACDAFAEISSSEDECISPSESAARSASMRQRIEEMQKELLSYLSSGEERETLEIRSLSSELNNIKESKKRNRRKRKKKLKKMEKSDGNVSSNFTEEIDPLEKLKDNCISVINQTKKLHFWERRCIYFLMDRAKAFSEEEKVALFKKVEAIPLTHQEDEKNIKQLLDLIELEEKSDKLYLGDENKRILKRLPFPGCDENIREEFLELMISFLALSCETVIQAAVLGKWMPFLHDMLEKNESLVSLLVKCGLNDLISLLNNHASN